jgi:rubredoxin
MDDNNMNEIKVNQLNSVTGGQWTPGDWLDDSFVFVYQELLPDQACGCCGKTGNVYKGYYEPNSNIIHMKCKVCGSSVCIS